MVASVESEESKMYVENEEEASCEEYKYGSVDSPAKESMEKSPEKTSIKVDKVLV